MQRMTGALQVLSLTNALRDQDFEGFRRIAQGFLDQYGEGGVILVADRDGRQIFSSVTREAASLPPRNNRAIVDKVFAEEEAGLLQSVPQRGEQPADRNRRSSCHS